MENKTTEDQQEFGLPDIEYQPLNRLTKEDEKLIDDSSLATIFMRALKWTVFGMIIIGGPFYYFMAYRQDKPYLYQTNDKVCVLEKFDGVINDRWVYNGKNIYKISYVTPTGVKIETLHENTIQLGSCKKY